MSGDEPTSGLDSASAFKVGAVFVEAVRQLKQVLI